MGLLDDAALDHLRGEYAPAYQAVMDACDTCLHSSDFTHDDAVAELDVVLEWLLKSQGVPV